MKNPLLPLLTLVVLLASGCAHRPAGFSRAEWDALPPEKQAEYQKLQALADNEKRVAAENDRRYADQAARQAEAAANRTAGTHAVPR